MILGIDPKVDYAFKKLFGSEGNTDLLIDLLHAVLQPQPGRLITEVELLNPFSERETLDDKLSILDVKARDQGQRQFHVEMQMRLDWFFPNRVVYYWAKFHQQQMLEGSYYQTLRPTISICFVDDAVFPQVPEYHLEFRLWEPAHQLTLTDDLEIHVFQLPHFRKDVAELVTPLDRWCWFLRHGAILDPDKLPAPLDVPALRRAVEVLKVFTQEERERERYEARLKAERDRASSLRAAEERGLQIGEQRGLQIGEQRGLQIGEQRGLQIGRIHLCENLLQRPTTPREALAVLSLDELRALADRLEAELRAPRS